MEKPNKLYPCMYCGKLILIDEALEVDMSVDPKEVSRARIHHKKPYTCKKCVEKHNLNK